MLIFYHFYLKLQEIYMEFVDHPDNEANRRQRNRCSNCREAGHNKRNCPSLDVEQEAVEAPLRAQPRIEREGDEEELHRVILDEVGADREAGDNDEADQVHDVIDDGNADIEDREELQWMNFDVPVFEPGQELWRYFGKQIQSLLVRQWVQMFKNTMTSSSVASRRLIIFIFIGMSKRVELLTHLSKAQIHMVE